MLSAIGEMSSFYAFASLFVRKVRASLIEEAFGEPGQEGPPPSDVLSSFECFDLLRYLNEISLRHPAMSDATGLKAADIFSVVGKVASFDSQTLIEYLTDWRRPA